MSELTLYTPDTSRLEKLLDLNGVDAIPGNTHRLSMPDDEGERWCVKRSTGYEIKSHEGSGNLAVYGVEELPDNYTLDNPDRLRRFESDKKSGIFAYCSWFSLEKKHLFTGWRFFLDVSNSNNSAHTQYQSQKIIQLGSLPTLETFQKLELPKDRAFIMQFEPAKDLSYRESVAKMALKGVINQG